MCSGVCVCVCTQHAVHIGDMLMRKRLLRKGVCLGGGGGVSEG